MGFIELKKSFLDLDVNKKNLRNKVQRENLVLIKLKSSKNNYKSFWKLLWVIKHIERHIEDKNMDSLITILRIEVWFYTSLLAIFNLPEFLFPHLYYRESNRGKQPISLEYCMVKWENAYEVFNSVDNSNCYYSYGRYYKKCVLISWTL